VNAYKKQLLLDFPWGECYPKLVAFAEWRIQGMRWNSGVVPMGHTAESIIQEAIAKTFSEERNWKPEEGDLLMWLKYVIKSEISHLAESITNRLEVPLIPMTVATLRMMSRNSSKRNPLRKNFSSPLQKKSL